MKQYEAVIQTLEKLGRVATLGQLNQEVFKITDCEWNTKLQWTSGENVARASAMWVKTEADALYREYVLSQIRRQVDFIQMKVAKRLGISQPTYAECERGNNMRIGTLQKIVAALGGELLLQVKLNGDNFDLQMKA